MQYSTKETIKIFWRHAKKYKGFMIAVYLCILIGDIFSVITPFWYKKFFDLLPTNPSLSSLLRIVALIAVTSSLHWLFIRISAFMYTRFVVYTIRDIMNTCFEYLHKHSFSFFDTNFVGSLVKRVNRFYGAFQGLVDRFTWDFFPIVINIIMIIIVLSTRHVVLGVAIFVWVIIFAIISIIFSRHKLRYDTQRAELDSKTTAVLADTITNHANVKFFVGFGREKKNFSDVVDKLTYLRRFTWDLNSIFDSIQWIFMLALEIGLMYIAIGFWQDGTLSIGDFVLIQTYLNRIFEKMWGFGRVIRDTYENLADAEEMTKIFLTPHEIIDSKTAKDLHVEHGEITFDNVTFVYHKTRVIIKNLDLTIRAGQKIALVGSSGAGKSTMVKLLLRQHDVSGGSILIDGQKIARVTQTSLWHHISFVPQDPILFHRTLIENIRYGKPDTTDEEVMEAARLAHCHEFIMNFPDAYDTYVGERGVKLSGGERQRVAIARALLKNAPILILDEATSSLDSESEHLIQEAFDNLMKGKTVIVIAHRLSTIMQMDRIIVMEGGGIIEDGTHTQLLRKKDSIYKKLWHLQAGGFIQ